MFNQFKPVVLLLAAVSLAALPAAPASTAVPGTLNYLEGQVSVNRQAVTSKSVGSVEVEPNQVMETSQGRAEIQTGRNLAVKWRRNGGSETISYPRMRSRRA